MKIEGFIKGGQLTEIEPEKVSLVKSPANKRRFILTKSAKWSVNEDEKGIFIDNERLESDNVLNLAVSGDDVYLELTDKPQEETKTMTKSEILKNLKDDLGIEVDEAVYDAMEPEKQEALTGMAVFSKAMAGQPVFRKSAAYFVKSATEPPAEEDQEEESQEEEISDDAENRIAALEAKVKELEEGKAEEPGEETPEPVTKADLKAVVDEVKKIAKSVRGKDSSETEVEKSEIEDPYPSIDLS